MIHLPSIHAPCISGLGLQVRNLWCRSRIRRSLRLGLLLPGKVLVARDLLDGRLLDAADVDLCPGSNDVAGVDAAERNTVDLEWTGDEEDSLGEVLEEDDALATEAAGEENEDGTRLER